MNNFFSKETVNRLISFIMLEVLILSSSPLMMYSDTYIKDINNRIFVEINNYDAGKDVPIEDKNIQVKAVVKEKIAEKIGKVITYKDVKIEIPEGAVKGDVEITIEELSKIEELDPGMENATGGAIGYRFLPDGMKFEKEIKITLPYDKTRYKDAEETSGIYTYFYDEQNKYWNKLARLGIDVERGVITSLTTHFTDMINSTLKLPESPKPLSFNPNSIKDIKAANPLTGIPEIRGLEASPFGSAAFSLPLTLPPGRNGMSPNLGIEYNSGNGNGWLGVGFYINIPMITIDTKFGVPDYDKEVTYLLNGSELVRDTSIKTKPVYKTRIEGGFSRIIRFGENAGNYYFEVTGKDGIKQIYGGTADSISGDTSKGIYKWFLRRMTDLNGNCINYYYTVDRNDTEKWQYTYLSRITYTGYNGSDGIYSIVFDNSGRDDIPVDCRGKYICKLAKKLSGISIYYKTELIRRYELNYDKNDFEKSQLQNISEYVPGNDDPFYTYQFKYKTIRKGGDLLQGYKDIVEIDRFNQQSANRDYSFGGGGSFYAGLGIYGICTFGLNVGFNIDYSFNNSSLMDMNGDGLVDFIRKDLAASRLQYKLNGYNAKNNTYTFTDPGLDTASGYSTFNNTLMNESTQVGFDVGISGGLNSVISGSFGGKFDWTFGISTFMDMNGDGIIDYIPSNGNAPERSYYLKGTGTGFEKADWGDNEPAAPISGLTDPSADKIKNSLYLIDPVIKWKAYKKGIINLDSKVRKVKMPEETVSDKYDGVRIDMYKNNISLVDTGDNNILIQTSGDESRYDKNKNIVIDSTADNLFFRVNSRDNIESDRVNWDLEIAYKKIYFREDMKDRYESTYDLSEDYTVENYRMVLEKIAGSDDRNTFRSIYEENRDENTNALLGYRLKPNLSEKQMSPVRRMLIDYNIRLRKYYEYNKNLYNVRKSGDSYYIEIKDDAARDIVHNGIVKGGYDDELGTVTAKGLLYDKGVDADGNVILKKWLKDKGNDNIELFIEENNSIHQMPSTSYSIVRTGDKLTLREYFTGYERVFDFGYDDDLYKFAAISRDYFIDLSDDINSSDTTHDMARCYALGTDENFHLISGYDNNILNVIKDKLKERGIAHYIDRIGNMKLYDNICYDVTIQENPGNITEETVSDKSREKAAIAKTSYFYEDDFLGNGNTFHNKKYIHIFDRKGDFTLDHIERPFDFNSLLKENLEAAELEGKLKYLRDKDIKNEKKEFKTNKDILKYLYAKSSDGEFYVLNKERASMAVNTDGSSANNMTYGQNACITLFNLGYGDEYFSGGVYNWFYGEWNGKENWDTGKFGIVDEVNNSVYLKGMNVMTAYVDDRKGGNANKLGFDTWKGSEFVYTERKGDAGGNLKDREVYHASFVSKDYVCPSRKGGDTIKYIPAETGIAASGMAQYLRQSFLWAINAGANVFNVSANFSYNRNVCFKDLMDMNGDNYPDEVKQNLGSGKLEVTYNRAGIGFGGYKVYDVMPDFRVVNTTVVGVGLGLSTQMINDWKRIFADPRGGTKAVSVTKTTVDMSGGGSIGGNFSGSMTEVDWIDINGDGLPDQVSRGAGDSDRYVVKLNVGDEFIDQNWNTGSFADKPSFLTSNDTIRNSMLYGGNFSGTIGTAVSKNDKNVCVDFTLGVGFSGSASNVEMLDINGDGLPDQVYKWNKTSTNSGNFFVRLNLGDKFGKETEWDAIKDWNEVSGLDLDNIVTKGVTDTSAMIGQYIGGQVSVGNVNMNYGDLDKGISDSGGKDVNIIGLNDAITYSSTFNLSIGADVGLNIPVATALALNLSLSGNFAFSTTGAYLQMNDINGDDLPDHVLSYDNRLFAKINNAGTSGLLETIITPQGGTISIDYERTQNTVEMPNSMYVMTAVTRSDGMGNDYRFENEYMNPKYDRKEREYYGHQYVKKLNPNGTFILEQYFIDPSAASPETNTRDFYTKGLLVSSKFCDASGRVLTEEQTDYDLVLIGSYAKAVIFPKVTGTRRMMIDDNGQTITTAMSYDVYDDLGNMKEATDRGDIANDSDDISVKIEYAHEAGANSAALKDNYLMSLPYSIDIREKQNSGNQLRYREAAYNDGGDMIQLRQYLKEQNAYSIVYLEYDPYGNLSKITDPNSYYINYTYDEISNTYMTGITDSGNYTSSVSYDMRLGVDLESTDVSGNRMIKQYDEFGRLSEIFTSYDSLSGTPAVEFRYILNEFPKRAITKNKVRFKSTDKETLDTVIVTDGLGRVIQTKKEGEVIIDNVKTYGMNVSGVVVYDNMGRVIKQGQPLFQYDAVTENLYKYWDKAKLTNAATNAYDDYNRVILVSLPDGSTINTDYSISNGQFVTRVTDPMNKIKTSYADSRNNVVRIEQTNNGKLITTRYEYDILNEITKVIDTQNNITSISYDSLGRRTSINNPDSGLIEYTYDLAGNLIKKVDPNLRTKRIGIEYEYDGCNRLTKIKYPESKTVEYIYGAYNDGNNSGKLTRIVDESGITDYNYGDLGELTSVTKTLKSLKAGEADAVWTSIYLFDYLGRMENITYPDGEKLVYTYDQGGQIKGVAGTHRSTSYTYINDIGYDEFGQRLYIKYGNGTETKYTYDPYRRWLSNITTKNSAGKYFQNMSYTFDAAGNIKSTVNKGYKEVSQNYSYDDLYQLVGADGSYKNTEDPANKVMRYKQDFAYDDIGNMTSKSSAKWKDPGSLKTADLNYKLSYKYSVTNPHRAIQIGEWKYEYDGNGNVTAISPESTSNGEIGGILKDDDDGRDGVIHGILKDDVTGDNNDGVIHGILKDDEGEGNVETSQKQTELEWNEENRLVQSNVGGDITSYLYNAGGERTVKKCNRNETIYVDTFFQTQDTVTGEKYTITKHVFVGDTRIVSKLSHYYGTVDDVKDIAFEQHNQYYYHQDHLGSTTFVTNYAGNEYEHYEYTPYGETWVEEQSDQMNYINFKFTSKELDEETGLYYFGARYLDPKVSRWMSADPIYDGLKDGLSIYGYCKNNPLIYKDPTGLAGTGYDPKNPYVNDNSCSKLGFQGNIQAGGRGTNNGGGSYKAPIQNNNSIGDKILNTAKNIGIGYCKGVRYFTAICAIPVYPLYSASVFFAPQFKKIGASLRYGISGEFLGFGGSAKYNATDEKLIIGFSSRDFKNKIKAVGGIEIDLNSFEITPHANTKMELFTFNVGLIECKEYGEIDFLGDKKISHEAGYGIWDNDYFSVKIIGEGKLNVTKLVKFIKSKFNNE